jgi:phosphate transport system substrate-binding protein
MKQWFCALIAAAVAAGAAQATLDLPPPYQPAAEQVSGRISIWGHGSLGGRVDFMEELVKEWQRGFSHHHPAVEFENRLHGTASAIGALYTGQGDIALMGREIWRFERQAFREVRGYEPTGIDVLVGSLATRNRGYAIAVFVHRDNPIPGLSLRQLDSMFSVERRRGGPPLRTWGELGLEGEWKDRAITLYSFSFARGFSDYIEEAVLGGSRRWLPAVREFADLPGSMGGATDGGQLMLDALAEDPSGVAFSGLLYDHPDVRAVPLSYEDGRPLVFPTEQSVMDRSYPLSRIITLFIDRPPGRPVDPHLREFIRYILSREAQEAVLHHGGGYLPVLAPFAERELRKLD